MPDWQSVQLTTTTTSTTTSKSDDEDYSNNIKNVETGQPLKSKDGGYGWVIVFAAFIIQFIGDGVAYTFGLFFVKISEEYGGKSGASWIASIMIAVTHGVGPIGSILVNKYGSRAVSILGSLVATGGFAASFYATHPAILYGTVGVLGGYIHRFGFGLLYLPANVSVPQYFDKRLGFAMGIAVAGSGCGTMFFEWAIGLILSKFEWRQAYLITSGLIALSIPFAFLYGPKSDKVSTAQDDQDKVVVAKSKKTVADHNALTKNHHTTIVLDWSLLQNETFLLFVLADVLISIGFNTPFVYLPEIEQNLTKSSSSTLLRFVGGASVLSKIILGYFSDKNFINRHILYTSAVAMAGTATVLTPHLKTVALLRTYAAIYGTCMGICVSLRSVILVDLLGQSRLTDAFGLCLLLQAVGYLIGTPAVGYLYDNFGTYTFGFYFSGLSIFFSSLVLNFIPLVKRRFN